MEEKEPVNGSKGGREVKVIDEVKVIEEHTHEDRRDPRRLT